MTVQQVRIVTLMGGDCTRALCHDCTGTVEQQVADNLWWGKRFDPSNLWTFGACDGHEQRQYVTARMAENMGAR